MDSNTENHTSPVHRSAAAVISNNVLAQRLQERIQNLAEEHPELFISKEEAVAEPVESKETPQSLTDLFANFDKAEQTPNNNINQTATDKTPVAPLLDDEVKVVGFNNDSDLTVLNSPTQSHKSPDIER